MVEKRSDTILFAADSRKGIRYERNEDALLALPEQCIFAVADGMGGHNGGAVASNMLVEHLLEEIQSADGVATDGHQWPEAKWMVAIIERGNRMIFEASQNEPGLTGMGTTLSLMLMLDEEVICFHVGDSRIYQHHNFLTTRLTRDHTEGAEDIGQRKIQHRSTRGIQRAIGIRPSIVVDVSRYPRADDAEYLIVSDGVSDMLPDFEITNILSDLASSPRQKVNSLLSASEQRGGSDDKTAILIG